MKPLAVFLNTSKQNRIFDAFDPATLSTLRETLELSNRVYLAEELEAEKETLSQAEYIFSTWGMPDLTEEEIAAYFPRLKAVFYAAGSVQHFSRPFLARGVHIFSAWAANRVPVAEYTVAQIILAGKGFFQGIRMTREEPNLEGRRKSSSYCQSFPCNHNVKVGILGAGMIGSLVLKMLQNYQLEALAYDPFASDEKLAALGARRASLEEIFSECQTISCHIANLPETQRILNYSHFSRMKPLATFINTGRGAQVVEEDLIRALKEEPDRTALLDVTWPEPPEADSPLWTLPNVVLTPHIAGSMNNEIARMGAYMAEEYQAFSKGQPCRYEVSLKMLETMA